MSQENFRPHPSLNIRFHDHLSLCNFGVEEAFVPRTDAFLDGGFWTNALNGSFWTTEFGRRFLDRRVDDSLSQMRFWPEIEANFLNIYLNNNMTSKKT